MSTAQREAYMGRHEPIMKPSDLRRAVSEWAAQGFHVRIDPDGAINVSPASQQQPADDFDLVDMRR
ncbi:hypothetical protein NM680_11640 [Paracoccus sp. PS-1]|uniref:hypothetical protein n=1 Tax=Paracoccus sp. PS1 TaxID=2963938 RepID=UPI0027E552D8|nr:hypothetical protein [Paracoccus sp. PS1]MDQ7262446.1 hypothetical protein [Paracoccus sp. PS1]